MRPVKMIITVLSGFAASVPLGAQAQDVPIDYEDSVFSGDFLVVGVGAVAVPSYEGSGDTTIMPAAGFAGRLAGIGISARAAGASFDLWADPKGARRGITLGPVFRYRSNRTGDAHDDVVNKLGTLPGVIEGGIVAGLDFKGVLNPYDSLSTSVDFRWDISGHGGGRIIAPGVSYITPLSRGDVAGLAISSSFIDKSYANYNFAVTPAGAAASGLPVYAATGGLKDVSIGAFAGHDLDGNILNGGFSIGGGLMYSRLFGSAAQSPITRLRGRREQWIFGGGLAYTF